MKFTYREYSQLNIKIMEIDEFVRYTTIDNHPLIELLISMAKTEGSFVDSHLQSYKNVGVIVAYGYIPDKLISEDLGNKIIKNKGDNQ